MSTRKLGVTVQLVPGSEYEGGDLFFVDADQPAARQVRSLIVFPTYMRHSVTKVTKGTRVSFVTWMHGSPFSIGESRRRNIILSKAALTRHFKR